MLSGNGGRFSQSMYMSFGQPTISKILHLKDLADALGLHRSIDVWWTRGPTIVWSEEQPTDRSTDNLRDKQADLWPLPTHRISRKWSTSSLQMRKENFVLALVHYMERELIEVNYTWKLSVKLKGLSIKYTSLNLHLLYSFVYSIFHLYLSDCVSGKMN